MLRRLLPVAGALAAAAVVTSPAFAFEAPLEPVPSLTPAETAMQWEQLADEPPVQPLAVPCTPLRAVFYAGTDWLRLATKLAANASPCAQYYISVPPMAGNKTQFRSDQAWRIRALGPQFHALAEVNVTGWSNWVATNGKTWYEAGQEARRGMAAAGYDVSAGDTWVVNELSSAVRQGVGNARANMRSFIRGLYEGDGTVPAARGAVFVIGMSQATVELSVYQSRLQDWYEDAPFWNDMSAYVTDWSQESYGDVRNWAVPGTDPTTRAASLNEYLQHEMALARVAPASGTTASSFLASAYNPLANAAWAYNEAFGWTDVPHDLMQSYVSSQVSALRSFNGSRFGFAWAPKNLHALAPADFTAQTGAILDRLAAAIAGADACAPSWCGGDLAGAAFNNGWRTFAAWKPSALAFTTAPQTIATGGASSPLTVEQRTSTGIAYTAGLPVSVTFASSSGGGSFSTSASGPWTPTLTVAIASGAATVSVYYRDTQPGSPTITASAAGKAPAAQVEAIAPPADTTPPETTLASAPSGPVASTSATISFASEPGARFECSLDGAAFAACTSPASYSGLTQGSHTFAVRAVDAAGNVDPTPGQATWTVDTVAPDTAIGTKPATPTNATRATFEFSSPDTTATFECKLDEGGFAPCRSPHGYAGPLADRSHTFLVRAIDAAGNVDASPASHTWTVDTTSPETTIGSRPANPTNATQASFSFSSNETGSGFVCTLDGVSSACTSPRTYGPLSDGAHTFAVAATDAAGNTDPTPATHTWTIDTSLPETTITAAPANPTNATSATFTFSSTKAGSTFECALDGRPVACGVTYTVAEGEHRFVVVAVGPTGGRDPSPASHTWTVDTTAPETMLGSGPAGPTSAASARFQFTSEPDATFECKLDDERFESCSSPKGYAGPLAEGEHRFLVRAIDPAGNVDATPAGRIWTIDVTPPDTAIERKPASPTNAASATFAFFSPDTTATFECKLDETSFSSCRSPHAYPGPLADRSHTFFVRAIDAAGNVDASPASLTWTVDTTPPETSLETTPENPTGSTSARFTFSSEAGTRFECKLDDDGSAPCESPHELAGPLADGSHRFEVVSIDAAGNRDQTAATYTWTIDTSLPETTITAAPANPTSVTTASFSYSSTKDGSSFECTLDGRSVGCATTHVVAEGEHRFGVAAVSSTGRRDPSPASYMWTVDTTAPTTEVSGGPQETTYETTAAFSLAASEPAASFNCSLDGAPFEPCRSGVAYTGLETGAHEFSARATDPAGNHGVAAIRRWTVITPPQPPSTSPLPVPPLAQQPQPAPTPQPPPAPQPAPAQQQQQEQQPAPQPPPAPAAVAPRQPTVPPPVQQPASPSPRLWIGAGTALAAKRTALVLLACAAVADRCRGSISLELSARAARAPAAQRRPVVVRLGSASFTLRRGERRKVRVGLTSRAVALLRARGRLTVRALVVSRDDEGRRSTTRRQIVVRRPNASH